MFIRPLYLCNRFVSLCIFRYICISTFFNIMRKKINVCHQHPLQVLKLKNYLLVNVLQSQANLKKFLFDYNCQLPLFIIHSGLKCGSPEKVASALKITKSSVVPGTGSVRVQIWWKSKTTRSSWRNPCSLQGGYTEWCLKVPSNYSMIL